MGLATLAVCERDLQRHLALTAMAAQLYAGLDDREHTKHSGMHEGEAAAARLNGLTYGQLIHGLKGAGILLDRKVLADIAVKEPASFAQIAEKAKAFAPAPKKAARKANS